MENKAMYKTARLTADFGPDLPAGTFVGVEFAGVTADGEAIYEMFRGVAGESEFITRTTEQYLTDFCL